MLFAAALCRLVVSLLASPDVKDPTLRHQLTDAVRDQAVQVTSCDVPTGEQVVEAVSFMGRDASDVSLLDVARSMMATHWTEGNIRKDAEGLHARVALYESSSGRMLGSALADGATPTAVDKALRARLPDLFAPIARSKASERKGSIAVLEFDNELQGADGKQVDRIYFSDTVRGSVREGMPAMQVMTRENTAQLLRANGKKLEDCSGECEVETGKLLQADYVVSGRLTKVGTRYKLTLRLHETAGGALVGSASASGKTVDELDDETQKAVPRLIEPLRKP